VLLLPPYELTTRSLFIIRFPVRRANR